jgi:hypothetical protein
MITASSSPNKWRPATKYGGRLFEGIFHPDIFENIQAEFPNAQFADCEDGFIAPDGTFLDRAEAMNLARAEGLVGSVRPGDSRDKLYTEYLPIHVLTEGAP